MKFVLRVAAARAVAIAIAFALPAGAQPQQQAPSPSPAATRFKVPPAQLQALGIQLATLESGGQVARRAFPAQVVAAAGSEQVVSSPVAGLVAQLHVEPLQSVRAGAPLARLASAELGQLQLQLLQAASKLNLAQQAAKRDQDLLAEGIIAQRRAQEAQAALREAQAGLMQAKAALGLAGMSGAAIDRVVASGRPEDGVTLTAPRAGVVTQLLVKPGQRVDSTAALLHIAQPDALAVEVQVPASELAQWPVGTRVELAGTAARARVTGVGSQVFPNTQTTLLRAAIDDKASGLKPGQLLSVELAAAETTGFEVPLAAVARDGELAVVFVRTGEGFEARPVNVVSSSGQRSRVAGDLKAGEQVAVTGIVALKGAWQSAKEKK